MKYGEKLAHLLATTGCSRATLARKVSTPPGSVSGYIAGNYEPNARTAAAIAAEFNVDLRWDV